MDKEHLIDLISSSIISEIKDLEINEEKLIANNYLNNLNLNQLRICLLYTSPSPRDLSTSRMPSSA